MQDERLRTAVLGLDGQGELLVEAASRIDYFKIEAVADRDTKLAEAVAGRYKCECYDDYRQLLAVGQSSQVVEQLDCLLVAAGVHSCGEYVRKALKNKISVLKFGPLARSYEEACELVKSCEAGDVVFAVGNPLRFSASFVDFRDFLQEDRLGQVYLIKSICNFGGCPRPGWFADPELSGGGVVLRECYGIIDQILWNFDMPQQVYSLSTNQAPDRQQRLYLTEDIAVITMRFSETLFGTLVASSVFGPQEVSVQVYGKDRILTVSSTRLVVSDAIGRKIGEFEYEYNELSCLTKLLENFALSILSPAENRLCSAAAENLRNMAFIEAAYLSARTGMPEEPLKLLQISQVD